MVWEFALMEWMLYCLYNRDTNRQWIIGSCMPVMFYFVITRMCLCSPKLLLTVIMHCRHKHDSHRCTGLYGPQHMSFSVTHRPAWLPFCCFPSAPPSIFLYPRASCPVTFPSISLPSSSFSFCDCMRDILLLNTHGSSLVQIHPQKCL